MTFRVNFESERIFQNIKLTPTYHLGRITLTKRQTMIMELKLFTDLPKTQPDRKDYLYG